jgi:hypothetical protein
MKIGNVDISSIKIGSTDVSKVYIGSTEVWSAFTGLLDTYTGATAAYSLRQLKSGATNAIRVRRASDNAESDIGFVSGQLDTSTLETFCSGTDGFVTTWYDQSSNGNNATQSTAANQPQIVSSGSVILENGKPSIDFNGSQGLLTTSALPSFIESSNFTVLNRDANSANRYFGNSVQPNGGTYDLTDEYGIRVRGGNKIFANTNLVQHLVNFVLPSGSTDVLDTLLYINGASQTSTASQGEPINFSSELYLIGGTYDGSQVFMYDGKIQEIVHYPSDQSSNRSGIETNINSQYQIYWDGSQTSLLDTYGGSAAAYSLRALSSSYTGALIKVRRASDNAEQDIYAKYDGTLNTDALESFCASTDGFVTTWYDQSGNGYDATQTTLNYQPQIVSSGSTILDNAKPSISFDGVNNNLLCNLYGQSRLDKFIVQNITDALFVTFNNGFSGGGTYGYIGVQNQTSTAIYSNYGTPTLYINNSQQNPSTRDDVYTLLNGYSLQSIINSSTSTWTGFSINGYSLGNGLNTQTKMQELVTYSSDQSTNRTGIETNINNHYNIY